MDFPTPLSREEEHALARRWLQDGDAAAREKLLLHNARGALMIANNFHRRYPQGNIEDYRQDALLGMWHATTKYDPDTGNKFLTYAGWWCWQTILRAAQNTGVIRVPAHIHEKLAAAHRLALKEHPDADRSRIVQVSAKYLGWPESVVYERLALTKMWMVRLDAPVSEGSTMTWMGLIPDKAQAIDEGVRLSVDMAWAAEVIESCMPDNARCRDVLRHRLMFQDMSLEELGKKYGVTRERIRQIENSGRRKLRRELLKHPRAGELLDAVNVGKEVLVPITSETVEKLEAAAVRLIKSEPNLALHIADAVVRLGLAFPGVDTKLRTRAATAAVASLRKHWGAKGKKRTRTAELRRLMLQQWVLQCHKDGDRPPTVAEIQMRSKLIFGVSYHGEDIKRDRKTVSRRHPSVPATPTSPSSYRSTAPAHKKAPLKEAQKAPPPPPSAPKKNTEPSDETFKLSLPAKPLLVVQAIRADPPSLVDLKIKAWQALVAAEINIPQDLQDYFGGCTPTQPLDPIVLQEVTIESGHDLILADLPKGTRVLNVTLARKYEKERK